MREYLDLPVELIERGLTGRLIISAEGDLRAVPDLFTFNKGAASFSWRSIAAFFAHRIATRRGLDPQMTMTRAMTHFRTDLYRQHLRGTDAALPGASSRLEGALAADRTVPAARGQMILRAARFFDGLISNPAAEQQADADLN